MHKKKQPRIFKDKKGEFIKQWYFVRGKQKFMKIYVVDGMPADEFYRLNADPITLFQNGDYELLNEHEY